MKHAAFDEDLRRRAERETFFAAPEAENKLARAMKAGVKQAPRPRDKRLGRRAPALCAAAACLAAVLLLTVRPPEDRLRGVAPKPAWEAEETVLPLAQPNMQERPRAEEAVHSAGRWVRAEAAFGNDTQEIWLVQWSASADGTPVETPDGLIWLEPGASCTDRATWLLDQGASHPPVETSYAGYRVTADMLHWMDGDWLRPGQEGYEAQQAMVEDAVLNGALVLAPGEWENGMAGEMALVLPDEMPPALPGGGAARDQAAALAYYLNAGLLTEGGVSVGRDTHGECRGFDVSGEPLALAAGEGCVQRLMTADVGERHALFVIDCVFESRQAMERFQAACPNAAYKAAGGAADAGGEGGAAEAVWTTALKDGVWQDGQGLWHMTGSCLYWPAGVAQGPIVLEAAHDGEGPAVNRIVYEAP